MINLIKFSAERLPGSVWQKASSELWDIIDDLGTSTPAKAESGLQTEPTRQDCESGANGLNLVPHSLIMPRPETVRPIVLCFIRFVYFQTSYSLHCSHRTELLYLGFDYTWIGGTFTRCYKSSYSSIPRSFRLYSTWEETKICVCSSLSCTRVEK